MAFIHTPLPAVQTRASSSHASCPRMQSATPHVSRRNVLRLAGVLATGTATAALAGFDLKELKEDVEELNYEEEVTDVGPDPAEKNVLRTKKKKEEPAYRAEEKALVKEEEAAYDAMVAKELAEEARIKAQFSKK